MRTMTHAGPVHRRRFITESLERNGSCTYDQLAEALRVSSMTVRRDIDAMAREGLVIKTLGGVQRAAPSDLLETDLRSRLQERRTEKRAIAQRALELVSGHRTLFLDGGTTCLEFAT